MRRHAIFAATLLLGGPAIAEDLSASALDCGGEAFSSAELVEHRPARRGPLVAMPQTLCADVTPPQSPTRVDIYANPIVAPEVGSGRRRAPYDGLQPRIGGPSDPRRP